MKKEVQDDPIDDLVIAISEWLEKYFSFEAWKSIRNDIITLTEVELTNNDYDETERRLCQRDLVGVLRAEALAGAYAVAKWYLRQVETSELREATFSAANIVLGSCALGWDAITFLGYVMKTRSTGESYVELASMIDNGISWPEILDEAGVDWRSEIEDGEDVIDPTIEILAACTAPKGFYEAVSEFHDKPEVEVEELTNKAIGYFLEAFMELGERLEYIVAET